MNPIATAKQTASLLSLAGLAWVISHLPSIPDNTLYADLRRPAQLVLISASVYLFLLGLQAFLQKSADNPSARRELGWAVAHALVLAAVGSSLLRGARSFALLAGLEGAVSVVTAVSAVAFFVYGYSAWTSYCEEADSRTKRRSSPWLAYVLQAIACLPLVLSVAYLEWFPTEQAEQAQFQPGTEI